MRKYYIYNENRLLAAGAAKSWMPLPVEEPSNDPEDLVARVVELRCETAAPRRTHGTNARTLWTSCGPHAMHETARYTENRTSR